jgi:hypothetical protein
MLLDAKTFSINFLEFHAISLIKNIYWYILFSGRIFFSAIYYRISNMLLQLSFHFKIKVTTPASVREGG